MPGDPGMGQAEDAEVPGTHLPGDTPPWREAGTPWGREPPLPAWTPPVLWFSGLFRGVRSCFSQAPAVPVQLGAASSEADSLREGWSRNSGVPRPREPNRQGLVRKADGRRGATGIQTPPVPTMPAWTQGLSPQLQTFRLLEGH